MIYEAATIIDGLPGPAVDLDVDAFGRWLAICKRGRNLMVATQGGEFEVPRRLDFPLVRWTGSGDVVVVDTRTNKGRANAFIFTPDGQEQAHFSVGDGVADVVAVGDRLVVTYFDEGIFGGVAPSEEGLCVFASDGRLEFGYQTGVRDPVDIADCYCVCPAGRHEVCFVPYTGFPVVRLNIQTRQQKVHDLPKHLAGVSPVAVSRDAFLLHAPYAAKTAMFIWRPGEAGEQIGTHAGPLRGRANGALLSSGERGYTIVTAEPG